MKTSDVDIQVKDLMTHSVITVSQETPVLEVARLLITHRIGSVPVFDSNERLVGIISKSDLFVKEERIPPTRHTFLSLFNAPVLSYILSDVYADRGSKVVAKDIMNRIVAWVTESEQLCNAIEKIIRHKVNSLPVLTGPPEKGGRLIGILTHSDIIGHLISKPQAFSNLKMNLSKINSV